MELKVLSELNELKLVMLLRLSSDDSNSASLACCASGNESIDHEWMDGVPLLSVDINEISLNDASKASPPPRTLADRAGDMAITTAETIINMRNTPMMPMRNGLERGARFSSSARCCEREKNAPHKTMTESM